MSEYNPFEDSMPGKGLHEINNAPKESAMSPAAAAPPVNPPYIPPPNPPYEPYVPTAPSQAPYQPMAGGASPYQPPAPPTLPPGASVHYAAGSPPNAYAGAPAVRYDLAGNPLPPEPVAPQPQYAPPPPGYGGAPPPGYGAAPGGYGAPPYGAPQGAWPPAPGGSALFGMQEANSSGQQGSVPQEIERLHWNWGAYFLPVLWCRWHGMTSLAGVLAATGFIFRFLRAIPSPMHPVFYAVYSLFWFSVSVFMGLNGHKMAWRNRRYFGGVEEHLKVQRAWLIGGLLAGPVLWIAAIVFFISVIIASKPQTPSYTPSSYNSPAGGEYGDGSDGAPAPSNSGSNDPMSNPAYNGPAAGAPNPGAAPATDGGDPPASSGFHPN